MSERVCRKNETSAGEQLGERPELNSRCPPLLLIKTEKDCKLIYTVATTLGNGRAGEQKQSCLQT